MSLDATKSRNEQMTRGRFTGKHMFLLIVGFFVTIFLMNLVLAYFALGSWPGLLVRNGYDASQTYNEQIEQANIQNQLGWQSQFEIANDVATLRIVDKSGEIVRGLIITVAAARPTNESEDRMLNLTENQDGTYDGEASLRTGNWAISILAEDKAAARSYRRQFRIFIRSADDRS